MTDRELLELAAKAAEMDWCAYYPDKTDDCSLCLQPRGRLWNPLADDGDALRLAVKMVLAVSVCDGYTVILDNKTRENHGQDPYAATRLAIVRATAAIGESK
jgi:hypothetical protein